MFTVGKLKNRIVKHSIFILRIQKLNTQQKYYNTQRIHNFNNKTISLA
jgi:hypothetical protein